MLRFITRHGQEEEKSEIENHLYSQCDVRLSDLGKEQARLLGERLKSQGFKGKILASPYMQTLETANIIGEITDLYVIPFAPIRETFKTGEQAKDFNGLTACEMREKYSKLDPDADIDYPWWTPYEESADCVFERVKSGIKLAEELYPNEEILYVGHGTSTDALIKAYEIHMGMQPFLFNCALSYTDPQNSSIYPVHCDLSHISYEKAYSNSLSREAFDREYFESTYDGVIEIPKGAESIKGTKILHIGDTDSKEYPYYKKLINQVKPDIIIHTGDVADEVKVGRIPGTRYEYRSKIKYILKSLSDSNARIIIVPGNNDVPDDIKEFIPRAEVYPRNTIIEIDGVECRVGHEVMKMTFDKQWSFYGHGFTGEEWDYSMNISGGECRFNACLGSFVCSVSENKFYMIKIPKITR